MEKKIYFILFGVVLVVSGFFLLQTFKERIEVPFQGESCEEVNFDEFDYNPKNMTDRTRATNAWNEYSSDNRLKGYCRDGKRIGGLR